MKKLLIKSTFALLVSTGFIACQKETEVVTEKAEATTSVTAGPGPNEFTQRGPSGSVVIYSGWITKTNSDWTDIGLHEIETSITAPSLSTEIQNSGVVLMYMEFDGNVRPLPYIWFDGTYTESIDFSFVKQKITLLLRFIGAPIGSVVDIRFRYVLIPGTKAEGGRVRALIDYNNYDAVCNYYGIPK